MTSPARSTTLYARPLLATDLSEGSAAAANIAPLVTASQARGTAVMVLGKPELPARIPAAVREELAAALQRQEKDAEARLAQWTHAHGLAGWDVTAPVGRVTGALLREAHARKADLILTGSRGHGRAESGLLGSVSRALLHRADADVLVARRRAPHMPLRRILVATDLHKPSESAAHRARAIATKDRADLSVLHVIERGEWMGALAPPEGFDVDAMQKHLADALAAFDREHLEGRAEQLLMGGHAARGIVAKAAEIDADLVIVGTSGGGALSRMFLGSVADAVAERAPCSVLVVRS